MLNNNDWLSKQIGMNAINAFLEEHNKPMPGDDYAVIRDDDTRKEAYIKPDGTNAFGKWFEDANNFTNGTGYASGGDLGDGFGYINLDGTLLERDYFYDGKKTVDDGHNKYHYEDRDGNRIGDSYYYAENLDYYFKDGFATVKKESNADTILIDKNGKEVPQENGDTIQHRGNLGYGYYLTGDFFKMRGLKLKDANTGVTLDRYQDVDDVKDSFGFIAGGVKGLLASVSKKQVPYRGPYWFTDYREVGKENGILFFGNYWFLGSSNLKVSKENDGYHSKSEFGEFITKLPPIKAIDDNYLLCAHNNGVYVYDKKANAYGKSCDRNEVENLIRKSNAKQGYYKISDSMKALANYKKLNPQAKVKAKLGRWSVVCYPVHKDKKGEYFDLQPILLEFPQIVKHIIVDDHDASVMYNGEIWPLRKALEDLQSKAREESLDRLFEQVELTGGRGSK